jgi:hypothetical protein
VANLATTSLLNSTNCCNSLISTPHPGTPRATAKPRWPTRQLPNTSEIWLEMTLLIGNNTSLLISNDFIPFENFEEEKPAEFQQFQPELEEEEINQDLEEEEEEVLEEDLSEEEESSEEDEENLLDQAAAPSTPPQAQAERPFTPDSDIFLTF